MKYLRNYLYFNVMIIFVWYDILIFIVVNVGVVIFIIIFEICGCVVVDIMFIWEIVVFNIFWK